MRKISLFAVSTAIVALTFTACTNTEDVFTEDQRALDFTVFANKATRAAETDETLRQPGKAFGVWGYSTFDTDVTTVFNNQDVTYNGTEWEYSPLKYWDKSSSYEFYAYYPYQSTGVSINDGKNITVTDFNVTSVSATADHTDLMIANKVTRAVGDAVNKVNFSFNHILSNINLKFKKDAGLNKVKVTLKSVKLYGMNRKGTYVQTQSPNFSSGNWTTSVAVAASDADTEHAASNVIPATTAETPFIAYTDMLLIPQSTDGLKLDVTYRLGEEGADQPFVRTLDLSHDDTARPHNPESWGQNQKITYNFTINADVIEFGDPTVVDWASDQDIEVPTIE